MDLCGRVAKAIERLARERPFQHHLCAFREDEMIKEANATGRLVESEFLQGDEGSPSVGRRGGWWLRHVGEGNLDEFERGASFEEGCQIPNGNSCPRVENEPCKGGEVKITKVGAHGVQRETREFRHSSSENLWEFDVHLRDI